MKSEKIPLSHQTADENIEKELEKKENLWVRIAITGIITGFAMIIVLYIIALFFDFINLPFMLYLFNSGLLMVFFSALYFLLSGTSIWFGPSPQWADFKSRVLNQTIKPKSVPLSIQNGFKHFVTGIVILLMAS